MIRAILSLAGELGLDVVAEGIELQGQASEFSGMHLPLAQGFLFFPPLPSSEIDTLLASESTPRPAVAGSSA